MFNRYLKNDNSKILLRRSGLIIASFVLPFFIMLIVAVLNHMAPFGSNTFLVSDMENQFTSFYSYFKNVLTSSDDFTYTLTKCLGGDMIGFSAYYLHNPFLLLLFLFKETDVVIGIFWIMVIQLGLMGLTFYLYISDEIGEYRPENLIFSTAYGLLGYTLSYMTLPIYYNNLILLPLVVMGVNRFIRNEKRIYMYVISLGVAIWCNYYLGYMTCLFVGMYMVLQLINRKITSVRSFIDLVGLSFAGVALSAFSLIPTVMSLAGTKEGPGLSRLTLEREYTIKGLLHNMLPGTFTADMANSCPPYLYVGLVTLIGILLYLLSKKESVREKISSISMILLLVLCTWISGLDTIWHAFNAPVGFSHRFTFGIGFFMISLGAKGFESFYRGENALCIARLFKNGKTIRVIILLVALWQIMELSYNAYITLRVYEAQASSKDDFNAYYNETKDVIGWIQSNDNSLYRIEKDFEKNHNDSMEYAYAGLTHNSSCEKDFVKTFMGRMGFRNQGIWAFYNQGSTSFADSFLGVKYFVSRFDSTNKPYMFKEKQDDKFIFENSFALPLGFVTEKSILNVDMESEDPFIKQNDIAKAFGYKEDIYEQVSDVESTYINLEVEENVSVESTKDAGTDVKTPSAAKVYRKNENGEAYITYTVTPDKDCNLYCYISAPCEQSCELYQDGVDRDDYFSDFRWSIINLGSFSGGQSTDLTLQLTGDVLSIYKVYFYMEDVYKLYEWSELAKSSDVNLTKITSSYYQGEVKAAHDGLLAFSMPYENDWNIKIDGEKVETLQILDCLMAIDISEGTHTIEMKYVPSGSYVGIILSAIVVIMLLGLFINENHEIKKSNNMIIE